MTRFLCSLGIPLLVLLQGTVGRYLDPPPSPAEGKWELWEKCPGDSYVNGLSVRWDAGGLSGLRFHCTPPGVLSSESNDEAFYDLNIRTPTPEGNQKWTDPIFCERGIATGVQLLANNQSATTDNVALICSDEGLLFDSHENLSGLWSNPNRCNRQEGVCATQAEILTKGSVTWLETLRFDCCEIPHPASTCKSTDSVEAIAECENPEALTPLTCTYKKKEGLSYYNNENEIERSIYEDLGFDLISAVPLLSPQLNFDPSQAIDGSFALEDIKVDHVTAESGKKATVYQVITTCGFYQIHNDVIETKSEEISPKGDNKGGFHDVEGMQGDSAWEDEDDDFFDGDSEEKGAVENEKQVVVEDKKDLVSDTKKDDKVNMPVTQEKENGDDDWSAEEEEVIEPISIHPKKHDESPPVEPEAKHQETNDDGDWSEEDENKEEVKVPVAEAIPAALSTKPENKVESSVEPKEKEQSDQDEDDWDKEDKKEVPEAEAIPAALSIKLKEKEKNDEDEDDWDTEDKKEVPETAEVIPVALSMKPENGVESLVEPKKTEKNDDDEDDWDEEDEKPVAEAAEIPETLSIKAEKPEENPVEPKVEPIGGEDDWSQEVKDEVHPGAPVADVKAPENDDDDDFSDEDPKPEVEAKPDESKDMKPEEANAPVGPIITPQDQSEAKDPHSAEVEVIKNIPIQTESKSGNLQAPSSAEASDWDDDFGGDGQEEGHGGATHLEIPIVAAAAPPSAHDEMSRDDPFEDEELFSEEEVVPPTVSDPKSQVDDALGKRAFDFLQTDSDDDDGDQSKTVGRKSPLVDLSTLETSAREFGEQLSKDVSTFAVEAQKVIDEVKEMPIVQEGQKKIEETLKATVETVIGYNPPKGPEVDAGAGVDSDYLVGAEGVADTSDPKEEVVVIKKAGGFVGYIFGGMLVCVVIVVIVIFVIEKRAKGRDAVQKDEYKAEVEPTPEPLLLNHQPIRSSDEKEP